MYRIVIALLVTSTSVFAATDRIVRYDRPIKDQYIVMLESDISKDNVPDVARHLASLHGGKVRHIMNNVENIFSIEMTEHQRLRLLDTPSSDRLKRTPKGISLPFKHFHRLHHSTG